MTEIPAMPTYNQAADNASATFTFIIPVYNGMPYIKTCIESIRGQSGSDFEIVVLENASTDGTKDYLMTLEAQKQITVLPSSQWLSIAENWSRILSVPKGPYMAIVGADDSYCPHYLSEIRNLIHRYPHCPVYRTHINLMNINSEVIFRSYPIAETIDIYAYLAGRLRHTYFETAAGYMIRSADYMRLGGIDCQHRLMHMDDKLIMSLIGQSFMAVSAAHAANYRTHPGSESGTPDPDAALAGYYDFFNWILGLNDAKLNQIVHDYLPTHLDKISHFFSDEQLTAHRTIYADFGIAPPDRRNRYLRFKNTIFTAIKTQLGIGG